MMRFMILSLASMIIGAVCGIVSLYFPVAVNAPAIQYDISERLSRWDDRKIAPIDNSADGRMRLWSLYALADLLSWDAADDGARMDAAIGAYFINGDPFKTMIHAYRRDIQAGSIIHFNTPGKLTKITSDTGQNEWLFETTALMEHTSRQNAGRGRNIFIVAKIIFDDFGPQFESIVIQDR